MHLLCRILMSFSPEGKRLVPILNHAEINLLLTTNAVKPDNKADPIHLGLLMLKTLKRCFLQAMVCTSK